MACDMVKEHAIWKHMCDKETEQWARSFNGGKGPVMVSRARDANRYRIPKPGECVIVTGMRRRQNLNGVKGEIVSSAVDDFGRITVRVYDDTGDEMEVRHMKIQPYRLQPAALPARSASTPLLQPSDAISQTESARTCSRAGSGLASSCGSRRLGSAISAASMSAMSMNRVA
eukprot:gnl/TRDRNA2_/TRDRNA2_188409_c0_seq1.p1 gnl/TRDRNA2_/TRDRNA2_188409_c0~~gnl/TRDRNA2_/TRDRNA2_188409_c0_seq1.p1  ORF type:complete len:196 (+),score=29.75 gnl/TRDRNA2_/TRDRNA2_188409_c0_seq1:75-590(+)